MRKKDLNLSIQRSKKANELAKKGYIINKPLPEPKRLNLTKGIKKSLDIKN